MKVKEKLMQISYRIEESFFFTVIRRGLMLMIPLILVGGVAHALRNLPLYDYSEMITNGSLAWIGCLLNTIYKGTFGIFSILLVVTLSMSYGMERNEPVDKVVMYTIVSLGAYGAQLNICSENFNIENIGTKGSLTAFVVTLFACYMLSKLKTYARLTLRSHTVGMDGICATAIQTLIPAGIIIGIVSVLNHLLFVFFGVYSLHELVSNVICSLFNNMQNGFLSGLVYAVLLHVLWAFGFHGSHLLEPVAQTTFANVSVDRVFSKSFFDIFVVMGGCGTTICVLIALLLFFRGDRMRKLAKVASFTVIFNLNEVLTFGIPIVLNPILVIPFILTPVVCYVISFAATAVGLVPELTHEVQWSMPVLLSGYYGTGSIRGAILQLVCIVIGVCIYLPFLRMHKEVHGQYENAQVKRLVKELQICELENEPPKFLTRTDALGIISRMLLEDLEHAIDSDQLYLLYQPQTDGNGKCLGAEALLRWNHPAYGFIYPPLIIYLAKDGGILPKLEQKLFDMAGAGIHKASQEYQGEFKVSVNITAKSLLWDIESCINECLKKYDIPPARMWLEITEQDVITNADIVIEKLSRLKAVGHVLMIDDFGMGHTSLIYLQSNHFNVVKLDGSLVKNILTSRTSQAIISSIVSLGNKLGINVVAEYVETAEIRDRLRDLGCTWYQGYYFSKPVPLDDFIVCLKKNN